MADLFFQGFVASTGIAGILVAIVLFYGARSDIRIRKFPKAYWDRSRKFIAIPTLATYACIALAQQWSLLIQILAFSLLASVILYVLSIRVGFGGDCRALIHIALLVPVITIPAIALSCVFGCIQIRIGKIRNDTGPAPLAVSIFCGFLAAFLLQMWLWIG